jgi:hypothetical protein
MKLAFDWKDVKNISRTTVNKQHTEHEATSRFKKMLLISEHSPIRELVTRWRWEGIKSWVATHFSRHKWECYIGTQRSDRTNVDRDKSPQGVLVDMDCSANMQQKIDTGRKRLCYCSSPETRKGFEAVKIALRDKGEVEASNVLVPNCVYRGHCPEFVPCGMDKKFVKQFSSSIQDRYNYYNKVFYRMHKDEYKSHTHRSYSVERVH